MQLHNLQSWKLKDSLERFGIKDDNLSKIDSKDSFNDNIPEDLANNIKQALATDYIAVNSIWNWLHGRDSIGIKKPKVKTLVKDAMTSKNFGALFSPTIEFFMRSYIMPQLNLSSFLFRSIPWTESVKTINIKSIGLYNVEEVAESEEYPETYQSIGDKTMQITSEIRKYGVKMGITEEVRNSENYGLIGLYLRNSADAFKIRRESEAYRVMDLFGTTLYDNASPQSSIFGSTTGRGQDGTPNGTISLNDLMQVYVFGQHRGINIDTIIMNPFGWMIFATDPELKELVVRGNQVQTMPTPNGGPAAGWDQVLKPYGPETEYFGSGYNSDGSFAGDPLLGSLGIGLGVGTSNMKYASGWADQLTPIGASFNVPPGVLPGPVRIITSPLVPVRIVGPTKQIVTNIILADSSKAGLFFEGRSARIDEWTDKDREIMWVKLSESYGTALLSRGRGVYVLRNVIADRNYSYQTVHSITNMPPLRPDQPTVES